MQNNFSKKYLFFLLLSVFTSQLFLYGSDNDFLNIQCLKSEYRKNISKETLLQTKETIIHLVQLIRETPIELLTNASYLENDLLLQLGLNNENLNEFPSHLQEYYGKGIKSWQYPNQFSKFLVSLSKLKINTYLEIGCRHGGTFIIICEYLKRFNPNLKSCAIDPFYSLIMDIYTSEINNSSLYVVDFSNSNQFINLANYHWDIAFIDGDHSFRGVSTDYNLVKNDSDILVFHDIVNDVCPGVKSFWNYLKDTYSSTLKLEEFIEQYEEVIERENKQYLGIGVLYQKNI